MATKKSKKVATKKKAGTFMARIPFEERLAMMKRLEAGETQAAIAREVGVTGAYISLLWQAYLKEGEAGLKPKPMGRKRLRRMTEAEQKKVHKVIKANERPSDAGLKVPADENRWSYKTALALIERELGFTPGKTEFARLMHRWRISRPRVERPPEDEFAPDFYEYINSDVGRKLAQREAELQAQWENEPPPAPDLADDEDVDYADLASVRKELRQSGVGLFGRAPLPNQRTGKHRKNRASPQRKKRKKRKGQK